MYKTDLTLINEAYEQVVLEEKIDSLVDKIIKESILIEDGPFEFKYKLHKTLADLYETLIDLSAKTADLPSFIKRFFKWVGKLAIGGVAGSIITKLIATGMKLIAEKLDQKRQETSDVTQSAVNVVAASELEKRKKKAEEDSGAEMTLEDQVALQIEIANKLQEKFPVIHKTFWVRTLENAAKATESSIGLAIGGVLGAIATAHLIPVPVLGGISSAVSSGITRNW